VFYKNNLWLAVGYTGQVRISTDAVTWTTQTTNFGNSSVFSAGYGNNLWVVGGTIGQIRTSTVSEKIGIYLSQDGTTWTTNSFTLPITNYQINDIEFL